MFGINVHPEPTVKGINTTKIIFTVILTGLEATMEFFLNVITEFSGKNICHYNKGLEPAISCLRDQDASTAPADRIFQLSPIYVSMIYQIL